MKVLIADDDRVFSHMVARVLQRKGWEVVPAYDAMQAVMFATRESPHVIVLDIGMPGGTGLHALERLQASSRTAAIPVVVVSATPDTEVPAKARQLGAAGFLPKPVDPADLVTTLLRVMGGGDEPGELEEE